MIDKNKNKMKPITFPRNLEEKLLVLAEIENRSFSNLIVTICQKYIEQLENKSKQL